MGGGEEGSWPCPKVKKVLLRVVWFLHEGAVASASRAFPEGLSSSWAQGVPMPGRPGFLGVHSFRVNSKQMIADAEAVAAAARVTAGTQMTPCGLVGQARPWRGSARNCGLSQGLGGILNCKKTLLDTDSPGAGL